MNLQLNEWLKTKIYLSIMISFVFPKSLDMRLIVSQAQALFSKQTNRKKGNQEIARSDFVAKPVFGRVRVLFVSSADIAEFVTGDEFSAVILDSA